MMAGCILWLALPLLGGLGARPALRHHTQSTFVQVEQGLLLVVLLFVHSSDLDDLAHDLRLEAAAFGFGVTSLISSPSARFSSSSRSMRSINDLSCAPAMPPTSGMIPSPRLRPPPDGSRTITASLLPNQRYCAAARAAWLRRGSGARRDQLRG